VEVSRLATPAMTTTLYCNPVALWQPSRPRQPERLDMAMEDENASPRWCLVVARVTRMIDNDGHRYHRPNQECNHRHEKSYHSTTMGTAVASTAGAMKTTTRSTGTAPIIGMILEKCEMKEAIPHDNDGGRPSVSTVSRFRQLLNPICLTTPSLCCTPSCLQSLLVFVCFWVDRRQRAFLLIVVVVVSILSGLFGVQFHRVADQVDLSRHGPARLSVPAPRAPSSARQG
jgi:hypothetical protein